MPKGPKGEHRPGDVIGAAVKSMRVLTGEDSDDAPDDGKDPNAKALGAKGTQHGRRPSAPRSDLRSPRKAAAKRWKKR